MSLRLSVTAQGDAQGRVFHYDFDDDRAQILLGRRGGVDVLLPHTAVALVHARIERRQSGYSLVDDGSAHGTWLNGARLEPGIERPLRAGDHITIAEFDVELAEVDASDAQPSAESSISMARRMAAEVLGVLGPGDQHPQLSVEASDGPRDGGSAHDGPRLSLAHAGRGYVVGRGAGCDLALDDPTVAPQHVRFVRNERGEVVASDLGSSHGLYVNDKFVTGERVLHDGDVLGVGRTRLRFGDPAEIYLRRLEQASPRDELAPPASAARPTPRGVPAVERVRAAASAVVERAPRDRSELVVVSIAAAVALAALAALVYLWAS